MDKVVLKEYIPNWMTETHLHVSILSCCCYFCVYYLDFGPIFLLQGIMGILSGSLGQEFFEFCYNPVGEVSVVQSIELFLITFNNIFISFLEANGHDDASQLYDKLHPLLHHVSPV